MTFFALTRQGAKDPAAALFTAGLQSPAASDLAPGADAAQALKEKLH